MRGETHYMPYEQCNRCRYDHSCWKSGALIDIDGETPNHCKGFKPKEDGECR